jgi:transcription elongation GreA/GreB family factor
MARALVGKSKDDEVEVKTPEGERYFVINAIEY